MRQNMLAVAAATVMFGFGMSPNSRYRKHRKPTLDEVEYQWVQAQMRIFRLKQRRSAKAVEMIAKMTGPYAHRYGYGPHPQSREVQRRLRQKQRQLSKQS